MMNHSPLHIVFYQLKTPKLVIWFPANTIKFGLKEQLLVRNSVEGLCEITEDHVDLTTDLRVLALS